MLTRVGATENLVRLADLVTVRRDYVSPKVKPVYFNGTTGRRPQRRHAARPGRDAARERRFVPLAKTYENGLPIGYAIELRDVPGRTGQRRRELRAVERRTDLRRRGGLVVLFLGLRAGLVAAMIVPFAVMFSFLGMRVFGIALEQVSIAAIIIALGLLVDNGVVIVEDIMGRIGRGTPAREAALASGQQYAFPLAGLVGDDRRGLPAPLPLDRGVR